MPEANEDYISEDNPVRFLDEYVAHLNLQHLGFPHVVPETRGRPPARPPQRPPPPLSIRLPLHYPLQPPLEREANRNLEVICLLKRLAPEFKTVADFH
jgi:hypothetical protein